MSFPPVGMGAVHCAGHRNNGAVPTAGTVLPARRASGFTSRQSGRGPHDRSGTSRRVSRSNNADGPRPLSGGAAGSLAVSALGPRAQAGPPPGSVQSLSHIRSGDGFGLHDLRLIEREALTTTAPSEGLEQSRALTQSW